MTRRRPRARRVPLTREDREIMQARGIDALRVGFDEHREDHATRDWFRRRTFLPREQQVVRDVIYYPDYRTSTDK